MVVIKVVSSSVKNVTQELNNKVVSYSVKRPQYDTIHTQTKGQHVLKEAGFEKNDNGVYSKSIQVVMKNKGNASYRQRYGMENNDNENIGKKTFLWGDAKKIRIEHCAGSEITFKAK